MPLVPSSFEEAIAWLEPIREKTTFQLVNMGPTAAEDEPGALEPETVIRAWAGVAYAFPGLHPDEAPKPADPLGIVTCTESKCPDWIREFDHDSGWPKALLNLAEAAWHLYDVGLMADDEFYNNDAQLAGLAIIDTPDPESPNPSPEVKKSPIQTIVAAINEPLDFVIPNEEPPDHDILGRYIWSVINGGECTQDIINDLDWAANQLHHASRALSELDEDARKQIDTQLAE
jgi:hypothetical protein